jgi:hypothetical protein
MSKMTLGKAKQAKGLYYLEPYEGFKPCRGLTGRYYYHTALDSEDDEHMMVEVKIGWFKKKWVYLHNLKEVYDN